MATDLNSEAQKAFVRVLIAARKEAGLSQVELAERLGRRQNIVSAIETGQRRVDVLEFCRLAKALGLDPEALFRAVIEALPDVVGI